MKHYGKTIGLHNLVDGFLFSLEAEGKAPRTHEYYSKPLRHFLHYARDRGQSDDTRSLDARRVRDFLYWTASRTYEHSAGNGTRLVRQCKPTSAWPYFRTLRRLFNWAVEEGFLDVSPLAKMHFKPPTAPQVEPYTQEELKRLLAVCDLDVQNGARFTGLTNRAMLLLFLDSGLRRAEMATQKLRDLHLEARRLTVIGKGNKVGVVPFCPKTAKAIWLYLMEREARAKCDSLWLTEEGSAFSIDGMDSWFNRLKQRAGVTTPGCLHKLRHTSALSLVAVMMRLFHRPARNIQYYNLTVKYFFTQR